MKDSSFPSIRFQPSGKAKWFDGCVVSIFAESRPLGASEWVSQSFAIICSCKFPQTTSVRMLLLIGMEKRSDFDWVALVWIQVVSRISNREQKR